MSLLEFMTFTVKADPSLEGSTPEDKASIEKLTPQTEGWAKDLPSLNERLIPLTYLHSNVPSSADVSLYCNLYPSMVQASSTTYPSIPAVLRYFLHMQSIPPVQAAQSAFPNSFPPLDIDVSYIPPPPRQVIAPPKKEKKEKAAPAAGATDGVALATPVLPAAEVTSGGASSSKALEGQDGKKKDKKEKKEKPAKPQPVKEEPLGPMPSMIDMRVGKVLDVKKHPDAETLYVEQIDVGEEEPRTVCSGLVKYMSEDQIRGATIIVICNLKPVSMRGVKSFAMLLCASSKDGKDEGGIEFVLPPEGSQPGERIYFEGDKYENAQPEAQLNPKKKVFETIQPGFTTLDNRDAAWIDPETKSVHRIRTKDGICKAKSFIGASLS